MPIKTPVSAIMFSLAILIVDQISKWWILSVFNLPEKGSVAVLPFFNLTMVWNRSISMGLLPDALANRWFLIVLTAVIAAGIFVWMLRTVRPLERTALAMVFGGAVGNLIDRLVHGAVVDFIHLHAFGYNYYVFNIADSMITIGVILLLIDGLRDNGKSPKNAVKDGSTEVDSTK